MHWLDWVMVGLVIWHGINAIFIIVIDRRGAKRLRQSIADMEGRRRLDRDYEIAKLSEVRSNAEYARFVEYGEHLK